MSVERILLALMLAPTATALAHHSFAEYDRSSLRELEGELVDVRWRNPHVTFTVRVADPDGGTQDWSLETSAVYVLERAGIDGGAFSAGQHVRVAGHVSGRRPHAMNVSNLLLPGGREILFYPSSRSRWSAQTAGGEWLTQPIHREANLFRVWSVADFDAYLEVARDLGARLTPEAEANVPDTSPLDPCVPQGMPGTMLTPLPIQLVDRGDHLDLQLTTFGVLRQIHFEPPTADVAATDLGYSQGRWVDGTLEVTTTHVAWPYLDDAGTPQSRSVEILEEFALIDDGGKLRYTQTIRDPETLLEPVVTSWDFADIGEAQIKPLRCE